MMKVQCQNFARFIAGAEPPESGPFRWFRFWLHWIVCPFCKSYWRELRMIRSEARKMKAVLMQSVNLADVKSRLRKNLGNTRP
jgi:hypothetical protein